MPDEKRRPGRPASDPDDKATIRRTWNARPSDVARIARLKTRYGSEGEAIRRALELLEQQNGGAGA